MPKIKCFAPWIHSYIGPNDQRGLCCQAKPFPSSEMYSFKEYWNSKEMMNARKSFIEGRFPSECGFCKYAKVEDEEYFKKFQVINSEELIKLTNSDGRYEGGPHYLDYRISNLCNLSCRTCSAEFSSVIEAKDKLMGVGMEGANKIGNKEAEFKELALKESSNEKTLYFASGESLIQPKHKELLKKLCDHGAASRIKLIYSTNLSYPLKVIESLIPLFEQFKCVEFKISFDSYGESGEFIRDGLAWNQFVKNLNFIQSSSAISSIGFYYVLTLPSLLNISETLDFLNKAKVPLSVCVVIPDGYAKLLSPFILEKEALDILLKKALAECSSKYTEYTKPLRDLIETCSERSESYSLKELLPLFNYAQNLDHAFKRESLLSFYESFTETKELVSKIRKGIVLYNGKSFYTDDPYWIEEIRKVIKEYEIDHIQFFNSERSMDKGRSLIVASSNSWLSAFLSKTNREMYKLESDLIIEEKVELGAFSFLLRRRPILRRVGRLLDFLTSVFSKSLALHNLYIVKKS